MFRQKIKNKKAQVFTWDLLFSLVIFLIILGILIYIWDTALWNIGTSEKMYEIKWLSTNLAEQLVRTAGIPKNWSLHQENVLVIGLADVDSYGYTQGRVLSIDKFLYFVNMTQKNYSLIKNKFLATGEYNFYIEVSCLNETENCFNGVKTEIIENAMINCTNNANFTVVNKTLSFQGEPLCIFGNYSSPSTSIIIAHDTKTAIFKNKLNSTIKMKLVIWAGESAPVPVVPIITTTTTSTTTTSTTTTIPVGFSCSVKSSCGSGEACVFTMYDTYTDDAKGAHAATCTGSAPYNNKVCCSDGGCAPECVIRSSPAACSPGYEPVLSLYSDTNAHVQDPDTYNTYTTVICCNTTTCGSSLTCSVKTSCDSGAGEVCLASMYSLDNSHLGSCAGAYSNKICCKTS